MWKRKFLGIVGLCALIALSYRLSCKALQYSTGVAQFNARADGKEEIIIGYILLLTIAILILTSRMFFITVKTRESYGWPSSITIVSQWVPSACHLKYIH
jgi:hypothetical protein